MGHYTSNLCLYAVLHIKRDVRENEGERSLSYIFRVHLILEHQPLLRKMWQLHVSIRERIFCEVVAVAGLFLKTLICMMKLHLYTE